MEGIVTVLVAVLSDGSISRAITGELEYAVLRVEKKAHEIEFLNSRIGIRTQISRSRGKNRLLHRSASR
ncbi:hypothetical protein H097_06511 [Pseudomonas sp. FH4]|nr:hypothetical protein H097_06511 [Pseudomonas sp. FH4]